MNQILKRIKTLVTTLESLKILKHLYQNEPFPDEVRMYSYTAIVDRPSRFSDSPGDFPDANAGGFSFFSKELSLLKCLVEAAERFCNVCYRKKNLLYSSFNHLNQEAVDPIIFTSDPKSRNKTFGFVRGFNLIKNTPCLIPAQLIYYSYHPHPHEQFLIEPNSTGAAGGFDHESTILRGIYEIVERDAFMTVYLAKIKAPKVDLNNLLKSPIFLKRQELKKIVDQAQRYNLELMLFDITTDLKIPSFLAMLVDRTGLGPSVSLGLKSSLSTEVAILGSMEEAFHTRPWMRRELLTRKSNSFSPKRINSLIDRGLLWLSPKMFGRLDFLLNSSPTPLSRTNFQGSRKQELKKIIEIFSQKGMDIYFADVTLKEFKKVGFFAYKVVIPRLQHLYLHESSKTIRMERLREVSSFFGQKKLKINQTPHPFL